jgi:hypothetical protein
MRMMYLLAEAFMAILVENDLTKIEPNQPEQILPTYTSGIQG